MSEIGLEPGAPLAGVVVLDLGQIYNAPYATFLMALAGADVVKVEPRGGEPLRRRAPDGSGAEVPYGFRVLNGNKRSVTLDLKHPRGRELLLELTARADVLVENYRPGVMDRLGLSADALRARNANLIVASSSGYGRHGPYRDLAAMDLTVQAMGGIMSVTGFPDGPPVKSGAALADFLAGIHLYGAIVTALYRRACTAVASTVEIAMLDAVLPTLLSNLGNQLGEGEPPPERTGNRHGALAISPYNVYPTKDGYIAVFAVTEAHWRAVVRALDRPELADDPRFSGPAARARNAPEVDEVVEGWAGQLTTDEAFHRLRAAGVPCSPVRTLREVIDDPHLRERGMIQPTAIRGAGSAPLLHTPLVFLGEDRLPLTPPPALGEHNSDVYGGWLGVSDDELGELAAAGVI